MMTFSHMIETGLDRSSNFEDVKFSVPSYVSYDEVIDAFYRFSIAAGYHPDTVKSYIRLDGDEE